jgi:RimJ/RimL family protein N-acetyltransferase
MNPDQLGDCLPTLRRDGLMLRWLTATDLHALRAIFSDADVVRFMSVPRLTSDEATLAFLTEIHNGFRAGTLYQWGLQLGQDIIGSCTLANINREHRRAELGFALARAFWRRGLIRQVLPSVIQFAFERLDLRRIEAETDPRNAAAMRVLESLGFHREGFLRERYFQFDEIQDAIVFGLLRRDWSWPGFIGSAATSGAN